MPMKRYKPEQIVNLLRQIEVEIANGKTTPQACKETEITVQTYYRWRKEYGGLKLDQAKRLKELERENAKLKRLVAELSLEKQILKDVAGGNFVHHRRALPGVIGEARRRGGLGLSRGRHRRYGAAAPRRGGSARESRSRGCSPSIAGRCAPRGGARPWCARSGSWS